MKVLIDTNVLLDFYCEREDFYQDAANIFDLACNGKIEIWVSPISFVNFFYITRKEYNVETENAMWDTGATNCLISRKIIETLHLEPIVQCNLSDASSEEDEVNYSSFP